MTGAERASARVRAEPPPPGPIRPYRFPAVSHRDLESGLRVMVVSKPGAPVASAMVVLRGGETASPEGLGGLAILTGHALEGGTERRSGRDLARSLEGIGAAFGAATGWDSTTVEVSCMPEHLERAMPLLAEMVRAPSFEEAEFARYLSQRIASAAHRRMHPGSLASDAFAGHAFAAGDSYARPAGGTQESLARMGPGDARRFTSARYAPGTTAVVVVGDVDEAEAVALVEEGFGDWRGAPQPPPDAVVRGGAQKRAVHVVHRPGSVQSEIRVGHVGVSRSVDDYIPLTVANLVLGGSFMSRLNVCLREEHGFTYGVHSAFVARRGRGPFVVSTAVENDVTAAAVREIHREVAAMAVDGPSGEEVEHATSYLAGVFPLRLESVGQIASRVAGMVVYDLPLDYYQGYREMVRSVTRDEAAAAARRHLRPGELCTVVAGDADAVAPALEELGVGPVTVHAPEEAEGAAG